MTPKEIFQKLSNSDRWPLPLDCSFLLVDTAENAIFFAKKDHMRYSLISNLFTFQGATSYFRIDSDRGRILEGFNKIELLINELFVVVLGGFKDVRNQTIIRALLERMSLADKIALLRAEGVITKDLKHLLWNLKDFRNLVAHELVLRKLTYRNLSVIDDNIEGFDDKMIGFAKIGEDYSLAWGQLIGVYTTHQKPVLEYVETLI